MVTIIQNEYFAQSPLAARLDIQAPHRDDERSFTLSLTSDAGLTHAVTRCTGTMFDDDLERLCSGLERLAQGDPALFSYATLDPSFLLRGSVQADGSVELLWVVDQGMAEGGYSTDTGIGILMSVKAESVAQAAQDLRSHPS